MSRTETESGVSVQIFVGCQINSELRMHLKYSPSWQQKQILPRDSGDSLRQLRYEGKDFVGLLLDRPVVPLQQLKELREEVHTVIRQHCPELEVSKLEICVFPQLFLS